MGNWHKLVAGLWGLTSLLSSNAWAEGVTVIEPAPLWLAGETNVSGVVEEEEEAPKLLAERNPFANSMEMELEAQNPETVQRGGVFFTPSEEKRKIPTLRLRGHLEIDGKSVALLEIGKTGGRGVTQVVHIVREGDTVGLQEFGSDVVLRISKIERLQVVVESGALGKQIIVR